MGTRKEVFIKKVAVGGQNHIVVQTMVNTSTHHIEETVNQTIQVWKAGAELVRITIPSMKDIDAIKAIKSRLSEKGFSEIPLIADIHFSPKIALKAAEIVDKVRINPGNFAEQKGVSKPQQATYIRQKLKPLVDIARKRKIALRIGVNHGSLSERMLERYGDTPEGMVASAMEYVHHLEALQFFDIIISLKSSNPIVMIYANRLLAKEMTTTANQYPIHLGVTEAGDGMDGRIKSAIGIGTLLAENIGDTIRVSLTEPPENEIPVARKIIETATRFQNKNTVGPTAFQIRNTRMIDHHIGGDVKPIVIARYHPSLFAETSQLPDFIYADMLVDIPETSTLILPWPLAKEKRNAMSLLSWNDYQTHRPELTNDSLVFLEITPSQLMSIDANDILPNTVLMVNLNAEPDAHQVQPLIASYLNHKKIPNPLVFRYESEAKNQETYLVETSILLGRSLIDGYADGVFIDNRSVDVAESVSIAFGILQATRRRITKTEYIACPSCGRTLFNLETTVAKIRQQTNHLKGVKIAVMGCIVNGIGEMADADYGYVGASEGKITLYKNREVVRKNIDERDAVDALIQLIKDSGDWVEIEEI